MLTRDLGNDLSDDSSSDEDQKDDDEFLFEKSNNRATQYLRPIENDVENYWPLDNYKALKSEFYEMNGIWRLIKLLLISDKTLFVLTGGDIDTYLFLLFLRNVVYLLTIFLFLDCGVLIPLYATGNVAGLCNSAQNNTVYLTDIQEYSLANGFIEYSRSVPSLILAVVNVFLVFGFTLRFKNKVDFVVKSTKSKTDVEEEQELYLSLHSMMIQNLNRKYKIHKTHQHLIDVLKTIYDEKLIKVTVIPELRSLDYMQLKAKEYRLKIRHFEKKNQRTNTRYVIVIKRKGQKEQVDAVDHFEELLEKVENDIEKIKSREYRVIGTAFVTFTDEITTKDAIKIFKKFKKENQNKILKEKYMIDDWTLEQAPKPTDIDWKNLAYDKNHRCTRKTTIGLFLLILSICILIPVNLLEQYLPMRANANNGTTSDDPELNQGGGNVTLAFIAIYFCPLMVYFINFIFIPFLIIKLAFYENNHTFSSREFSIMNKNFIYMVFGTVFVPGLQYTISLRFVQLLVYPKVAAVNPFVTDGYLQSQPLPTSCTFTETFNVFYSIDFFLMFMIQLIFISNSIQIFTVLPERISKYRGGGLYEFTQFKDKKRTKAYSGKMRFGDWYYSYDYQVAFATSVFSIVLVFSTTLPLIIPLGLLFFLIKFGADFNQRVILKQNHYAADIRHSDNTVRSSIVKYLFTASVLYLLIQSLIYTSYDGTMVLSYASFSLFAVWFLVCAFFWIKWRLMRDPKIGTKYDSNSLEHKEGFNIMKLTEMYIHPLSMSNPSPLPRHEDDNMRKDSNAPGFMRNNYDDLNSNDKFQMSELHSQQEQLDVVDQLRQKDQEPNNGHKSVRTFGHLSGKMSQKKSSYHTLNSRINVNNDESESLTNSEYDKIEINKNEIEEIKEN